ncbi:MAG TPA: MarR family transcriptional regulator [Myxococcota bacterium]|jgi:DNA-binding MarR family transcriptional regulator
MKRRVSGGGAAPRRETRPDDADRLARHLLALSTAIRDRISAGLVARGYALSAATTQVLPNLPLEGLGMTELASRLRLTLQRTGQLVQQLEGDGYVARESDARDGRAKRVVYTRRGRALVRDVGAVLARVRGELAAVIGDARFARFSAEIASLDTALNGEDAALLLPPRN